MWISEMNPTYPHLLNFFSNVQMFQIMNINKRITNYQFIQLTAFNFPVLHLPLANCSDLRTKPFVYSPCDMN